MVYALDEKKLCKLTARCIGDEQRPCRTTTYVGPFHKTFVVWLAHCFWTHPLLSYTFALILVPVQNDKEMAVLCCIVCQVNTDRLIKSSIFLFSFYSGVRPPSSNYCSNMTPSESRFRLNKIRPTLSKFKSEQLPLKVVKAPWSTWAPGKSDT